MQLTIGELKDFILGLVALIGAISAVVVYVKKGLTEMFRDEFSKINDNFENLDKEIKELQKTTARNYLSLFLSELERGEDVSDDEYKTFYANLEAYEKQGGDGYIHAWVDNLVKAGKLKK